MYSRTLDHIAQDWLSLDFPSLPLDGVWLSSWQKHLKVSAGTLVDAIIDSDVVGMVVPTDWTKVYVTPFTMYQGQSPIPLTSWLLPERDLTGLRFVSEMEALRGRSLSVVLYYSKRADVCFFGGYHLENLCGQPHPFN